jgi:hypothetical protein
VYEGGVCKGLREGTGTYTAADKVTVYEGQWRAGKREGKGVVYFDAERKSKYEGGWIANSREGEGTICYASGNSYVGQWKNNKKNGQGTMKWVTTGESYEGSWVDDLQEGEGTHVWRDGEDGEAEDQEAAPSAKGDVAKQRCNMYRGQFVGGRREGVGTFYYANGSQ